MRHLSSLFSRDLTVRFWPIAGLGSDPKCTAWVYLNLTSGAGAKTRQSRAASGIF